MAILALLKNFTTIWQKQKLLLEVKINFEFKKRVGIAIKSKETSS